MNQNRQMHDLFLFTVYDTNTPYCIHFNTKTQQNNDIMGYMTSRLCLVIPCLFGALSGSLLVIVVYIYYKEIPWKI